MGPESTVRGFVRGELDWRELAKIGVSISTEPGAIDLSAGAGVPLLVATAPDIARGLLKTHATGRHVMWAQILLAAVFVDISALHDTVAGRRVLEAVWNSSAGGGPSARELADAQRLAASDSDEL